MGFSLTKLILLLLIVFGLGVSVGWLLRARRSGDDAPVGEWHAPTGAPGLASERAVASGGSAPARVHRDESAREQAPRPEPPPQALDDLKRIRGVGPGLERTLHDIGITRFAQIAAWTDVDVARVDERLRFRGRIVRDDWIGQARELMRT